MNIFGLMTVAKEKNASDLHLSAGSPPLIRVNGDLMNIDHFAPMTAEELQADFIQIATPDGLEKFQRDHELDFKFTMADGTNLRCNAARSAGS